MKAALVSWRGARVSLAVAALLLCGGTGTAAALADAWSETELATLRSMSIDALPPLPPSPGNPVADDPRAVALGHRLFFDTRLGATDAVSCATCHQPDRGFRDGLARGRGIGETRRRTMGLVGAAWSPWLFWDGRRDSLWAQALEPLEHPDEHGGSRLAYLRLIASDEDYRARYEALFGALPDLSDGRFPASGGPHGDAAARARWEALSPAARGEVSTMFANLGRALEAYQRRLAPGATPFDAYARALDDDDAAAAAAAMSAEQRAGLALFIGEARCLHCHNGPLFTNNEFHNTGIFPLDRLPDDRGRVEGVRALLEDEFNCLGPYSGADERECGELSFVKTHGIELVGAFRTPSLRGVAAAGGPYMHTGQFATLREVLEHYDEARPTLISDDLEPLGLADDELDALEAFLRALDAPPDVPSELLVPPRTTSTRRSGEG